MKQRNILKSSYLDTPIGKMIAISDEKYLYLLEFANRPDLERGIKRLEVKTESTISKGAFKPTALIEKELEWYFKGKLQQFKTPIALLGTPFQVQVWKELQKIPLGQTRSYLQLAVAVQNPKGYRAVALANGANRLAIIVPCHRVIQATGSLGGYSGGIAYKEKLLLHESNMSVFKKVN